MKKKKYQKKGKYNKKKKEGIIKRGIKTIEAKKLVAER